MASDLNVVLLVQDAKLIVPVDQHDASVVARFNCHLQVGWIEISILVQK